MSVDHIRYDILAQEALRGMVRTVLSDAARKGLHGEHHFFISFDTRAEGVRISPRLHAQYPEEMTIVLQHQFWDLKVGDESFEVGLSFAGVTERLSVPFAAIKSFVDPSVQFALQFEEITEQRAQAAAPAKNKADNKDIGKEIGKPRRPAKNASIRTVPNIPAIPAPAPAAVVARSAANRETTQTTAPPDDKPTKPKRGGEVVRLDRFRKK